MTVFCFAPRAPSAGSSRHPPLPLAHWLAVAIAAGLPSPADSQIVLDPVIVTATREPQPASQNTADVVTIDARRLRDSAAESLEDLLRREAGLQLSRSGGPGQSAGVFIRGASPSSAVVLIDGVRVGSASLGQAELESMSLSQIERIEVLRGPASSLYGADAVGGVVQIFTRRGEGGLRLTARAAVGGDASREGDVGISGAAGSFDYAAALGHERSDGVSALRPGDRFGNHDPDRDGYARRSGLINLGLTPAPGHRIGLKLVASELDARFDASEVGGPPDFLPDASPDFRNRLDTRVVALDYRGRIGAAVTTSLQASRNVDDLRSGGNTTNRFRTDRDQFFWQNAWQFTPAQQVLVAYERLDERSRTDDFDQDRRNDALVVGYTGRFGGQTLQADLRRDDNSVYAGQTTGRIGWSTALLTGLRLRVLAGTTFRAPTFNDLYFPGYGVPGIRPERGRSIEAGLDWRSGATAASVTVYRNRVRDLIGYEPDPDRTLCPPGYASGCAANVSRARLQGATLTAAQRWGGFGLRAAADFLDATDSDTGQRLMRRAAHQESIDADYAAGAWTIGATVFGIGGRPDGGARLGSYATLDLRATWRFASQWRLESRLLNAGDRDVEPARDYRALGRQGWIGLRFDGRGL